ncbi:redox-sensitive transcriptional activator SoxR [Glaciecola sp. XM2]|jgi:MerR family redox-sensitive transcriptional activator SoxR|uniref:redox-sensitive transcriptional activator SoxR n=1 Tax=Glaciecola sp. XM2 TaxID=1914931 RepID=UPI001BDEEFA4|nr:redox-sensitive transcriptional activator SoxR [Glaciecola sp. XM2]MBT1451294.1 redox-sensitive transcriptional activator SoxR [Glaciecola sp. XM2]
MKKQAYSVGEIAKRCGVRVSTLHFYEQKGLVNSTRNLGNQRRYKPDVMRRVAVIKAAQKIGISLEEIKQALSNLPNHRTPTAKDWSDLSSAWQEALNERIIRLQNLRDKMDGCIGCGCLSLTHCPIYNPEDKLAKLGTGGVVLEQINKLV